MSEPWTDDEAQLALAERLCRHGDEEWWVSRANDGPQTVRGVEVPAGAYMAVCWRRSQPPVTAETLAQLERAAMARIRELREHPPQLTDVEEMFTPDQVRRLRRGENILGLPDPPWWP